MKLQNYVKQSVNEGARLVCGGHRVNREGFFFEPTILVDIDDDNFAAKEESFGPIMAVSKFDEK